MIVATADELLKGLQLSICQTNDRELSVEATPRVYYAEVQGQLHVEFFGSPFEDAYESLLQTLCAPEVAGCLRSLTLRGPDEGSNGTRNWDLTGIIESEALFPRLNSVFIEPTAPEHHNQSIVGSEYDEEGQIGTLLTKAPVLQSLTVPSAPDASFFQAGPRPLRFLQVDTGYAHQDFLLNLSHSDCFPDLGTLDFSDFNQRYLKDYSDECTPFEHYEQLFRSRAFQSVRRFNLRNIVLSSEQLAHLRSLRKDLQFYVIQAYGEYLR